mgnify:CR=1 FL=1
MDEIEIDPIKLLLKVREEQLLQYPEEAEDDKRLYEFLMLPRIQLLNCFQYALREIENAPKKVFRGRPEILTLRVIYLFCYGWLEPSERLQEARKFIEVIVEKFNLSQRDLAYITGHSLRTINELLKQ